ncbi:Efflux pump dotC [Exophiala dermatitidis]
MPDQAEETLGAAAEALQAEENMPSAEREGQTTTNSTVPKNTPSSPTESNNGASDKSSDKEENVPVSPMEGTSPPHEKHDRPDLARTESRADKFSKGRIFIVMFSLGMALFLAALDVTIITTALPTIADHFQASAAGYTWVGSAYLLANAASVPLWGKISDIWGRKPIIMLANVIFLAGSLIAALSTSIGMLIGARVIQGIGGGGLVILVNICIADLFSMRDRPKYYGFMGMVWAIASALGPVVGGAFTEGVSWRWCFYINLPLDGVSLILLTFFLKLDTPKTPFWAGIQAIDWIGVITIVGGVVMFLLGMESGGVTHPWDSAYTLCLIIFGIVTLGLFLVNEWKFAKYPIIPLRLFRDRSNLASLGVCFVHGFVFIASSYYLPVYFQTVLDATPILSGVYLFALVLSLSFASASVGIVIKKTGRYREPIWFGLVMMTLGYGLFIDLEPRANWAKIIIYQIVAGVGVGPNFQSPLIALQSHVKGHDIAVATALFGFVRNLSTSVSVVLGGVVVNNELAKKYSGLRKVLPPADAARLTSSSFGSTTSFVRSLHGVQKQAVNEAYTSSLRSMWIFYTAFSAFGIFVSLFITRKELSRTHEKARTGIEEQERIRQQEDAERKARRSKGATADLDTEKGV